MNINSIMNKILFYNMEINYFLQSVDYFSLDLLIEII